MNIVTAILVVMAVIGAMLIIRYGVKTVFPKLGTIAANMAGFAMMALEISNSLPWSTILEAKEAAVIGFGITLGNALLAALKHNEAPSGAGGG